MHYVGNESIDDYSEDCMLYVITSSKPKPNIKINSESTIDTGVVPIRMHTSRAVEVVIPNYEFIPVLGNGMSLSVVTKQHTKCTSKKLSAG